MVSTAKKLVGLALLASLLFPFNALANSESLNIAGKRAVVVAKAAAYGAGGGLVIGVASQVFKKKVKNIFVFGSLGLYAGIISGIYVISSSSGPAPYDGPDTYEDYGDFSLLSPSPGHKNGWAQKTDPFGKNAVSMNLVKLDF
jgi:hypothetical protein